MNNVLIITSIALIACVVGFVGGLVFMTFKVETEEMQQAVGEKRNGRMSINGYQILAMRTSNKKASESEHLLNGALGLAGESGEVCDIIKKAFMQGHPLDYDHIAKELGDVCWYIAETATAIGYDLETIFAMNIDKLMKRYPQGFSSERSQHRREGDV